MNTKATTPRAPRDAFAGMDEELVRATLVAKGWPLESVGTEDGGLVAVLGADVVAVVTVGPDGEAALARICGAHGSLPATPTVDHRPPGGERRKVRLFRAPVLRMPSAENLHGAAGGVSVVASGQQALPPRSGYRDVWAVWARDGHPSGHALAELPGWLADAARDPIVAAKLATTVRPTPATTRELDAWESTLVRSGRRTANTFGNAMKIFRSAPLFAGRFRLNLMSQGIEFEGAHLPEGRIGTFREKIEDAPWGGFSPSEATVMQAVRALAEEQAYHPVQDYLAGLVWDGVPRLDLVATELLHAESDELVTTMVRRWFIGAVARALNPGCQVDTALVLVGDQGRKKSSFFRALAGAWFGDTEIKIGDKDAYGQIHLNWITEWGEIDRVTSQRHAGEVKAFVSRRADTFRPPYGKTTATYLRSCVIVGSTNEGEFLSDPTGSRRFWVVRVRQTIDADLVTSLRDQLWAEAVAAYRSGEIHYLLPEEDRAREIAAEQYRARDAWEEVVDSWLEDRWAGHQIETGQRLLTSQVILRKALGLEPRDMDRAVAMRLGRVMAALGYANERQRVPRQAADLYRDPEGNPLKLVHVWTLAGALDMNEVTSSGMEADFVPTF
jgi:hypothetical protein